jgi:hypothetical protein
MRKSEELSMYKDFNEVIEFMINESHEKAKSEIYRLAIEALGVESWDEVKEKGYLLFEAKLSHLEYASTIFWVGKEKSELTNVSGGGLFDPSGFLLAFKVNTLAKQETDESSYGYLDHVTRVGYMIDVEDVTREDLVDLLYDDMKAKMDKLEEMIEEDKKIEDKKAVAEIAEDILNEQA